MINTLIEIGAILGIFILSYFVALKHLRVSLYVVIALSVLLHKELFSFFRWDLMPIRAFMLAALAVLCTKVVSEVIHGKYEAVKEITSDPVTVLLVLLFAVRAASVMFSLNLTASVFLLSFFLCISAFACLIIPELKSDQDGVWRYINYYILTAVLLCVFGLVQIIYHLKTGKVIGAFWVIPGNTPRVGSLFWDVNHYGSLLAAFIPVTSVLGLVAKRLKQKGWYLFVTGLFIVSLLLTSSRTAWMIDFFALIFFGLLVLVKKYGRVGLVILFLSILAVVVPVSIAYNTKGSLFREKTKQYFNYRIDSFDSHFLLLTGAYQVFEKYPILGGGYGSFFEHFSKTQIAPTFFGRDPAALNTRVPAHTIWGELLAETGVIGMCTFLLLIASIVGVLIYTGYKQSTLKSSLLYLAMASVVFGWMIAGIFYSYNTEFFWILVLLFYLYGRSYWKTRFNLNEIVSYFSKNIPLMALFSIGLFLLFYKMGSVHLIPWDEAIYAKVSKNMLSSGNWLDLFWVPGKLWFEKPPLFMWLMALTMKFVGVNSWAVKLPSALASLAIVWVTYVFASKRLGRAVGFFTGVALLTSVHYLYYSRMAMTDIVNTAFITLALVTYYIYNEKTRPNYLLISGMFVGLAVMTKGPVGFIPIGVITLFELYKLILRRVKIKELLQRILTLIVVAMCVFLPWHFYMYTKFGTVFLKNYLGYHVIQRATESIENHGQPLFWYVTVIKVSMRLWFIIFLSAVPYVIYKIIKRDVLQIFLVIWALFVFVFFSIPKSKIVWYIAPIYIPVAIISANAFCAYITFIAHRLSRNNSSLFRAILFYMSTVGFFTYFYLVRNMVFVPDFTGSEARMILLKDRYFGKDQKVYLDRVDIPIALFYTDGPFEIIDFNAQKSGRVPNVDFDEKLVLVTKKGRFTTTVAKYDYPPVVVAEDKDHILWYFESREFAYTSMLKDTEKQIQELSTKLSAVSNSPVSADITNQLSVLLLKKLELESKLGRR